MIEYRGRTAVVTGGTSGIGLAIVEELADRGMNVAVIARTADMAESVAEGARARGVRAIGIGCDVADRAAFVTAVETVESELGDVELVVLNAGVTTAGPLVDHTPEDWDWVLGIVLQGVVNGVQSYLPKLLDQGRGSILITSSMTGLLPDYFQWHGPYITGKAGVIALASGLRLELEGTGVGVSVLIPAGTTTGLNESYLDRPSVTGGVMAASDAPHPMRTVTARAGAPALTRDFEFLTTEYVARRALFGVENDEALIVTHPEFRPAVAEYYERILAAFDRSLELEEQFGRDQASTKVG
jgi:NAD(P)-dependent dehydrogenase (short-subunit alcohol dehydrogenase family)